MANFWNPFPKKEDESEYMKSITKWTWEVWLWGFGIFLGALVMTVLVAMFPNKNLGHPALVVLLIFGMVIAALGFFLCWRTDKHDS